MRRSARRTCRSIRRSRGPSSRSTCEASGWRRRLWRCRSSRIAPRNNVRIGILTISDLGAVGQRADTSGDAILGWAVARGYDVVVRSAVADETDRIAGKLARWADSGEVDVVLTTGGTGLTARDVTPEATAAILEREAPGIAEALRAQSAPDVPRAWLSRGAAGTRGKTLTDNLPGSPGGGKVRLRAQATPPDHTEDHVNGK